MNLLRLLKHPVYAMLTAGVSLLLFDLGYWVMATFPGEKNNMCVPGVNLTLLNITFTLLFSIAISIAFIGIIEVIKRRAFSSGVSLTGLSGISFLVALLTTFCTFCTLPVITLFGVSFGLGFITFYEIWFKLLSLVLVCITLFLLEKKLSVACACSLHT